MSSVTALSKQHKLLIIFALAVPFIAVVWLMIAAGSDQVSTPPKQATIHSALVQPVQLQTSHMQQQLTYGKVESNSHTQLSFELAGRVTQLLVDEGDRLSSGALLASLDTRRLDSNMKELEATLAKTKADLRLANLSLKRVTELVSKNLESPQSLDEVRESTESAKAQVSEINAKIASLQIELDKSKLYAQSNSTVLTRPVDVGTVVAASQPILTIQQSGAFDVRMGMPQDQAFSLQEGDIHTLYYQQQPLQGTIKSIAKQRQLSTRTVDVIFSIQIPVELTLVPGDLVSLNTQQKVPEAGVWVPQKALTSGIRGLWTLFVVTDLGQQQVISKSVEVLYSQDNKVFIQGALKEGDWLVINGSHRLVPGQVVNAALVESNVTTDNGI